MRMSFDLDGVVSNSEKWFFSIVYNMKLVYSNKNLMDEAECLYYATRSVRLNPHQFLSKEDKGFIITARKPHAEKVTRDWLYSHGIIFPISFIDNLDTIDWSDYAKASEDSGRRKASEIDRLSVDIHFDNNPITVAVLRAQLPDVRIIQYGGEPWISV